MRKGNRYLDLSRTDPWTMRTTTDGRLGNITRGKWDLLIKQSRTVWGYGQTGMWGFVGTLWVTPSNQESDSASGLSCPHLHTRLSFVWPWEEGNCEWTLPASVEYIHYRTNRKATKTKIFMLACGLTKPFLSAMIALQLEYVCRTRTEWYGMVEWLNGTWYWRTVELLGEIW